jgi:hypothetical protein
VTAPVELGFFSFTEVPAGHHHAYNEWHQLDHLPSQQVLPGVAHGERWVCTPAARAAAPVLDPVLGRAQYLTLYLMTAPLAETLAGFRRLAADLRDVDRFFAHRTAHLAGAWRAAERWAAPHALVDAAVVPWRPAAGVVAVVDEAGAEVPPLAERAAIEGVAGAWRFERDPAIDHPSWVTDDVAVSVLWVDGDPIAVAGGFGGTARHVAAYETIRPCQWGWFEGAAEPFGG